MTGKENREIKNSVFVDLFYEDESAEANEIALFNAIHDEPLPEGTKIRKFRVDNTIYMNFQNDISFDAGGKVIVFGEHQSAVNENMPLRSLLYIGRAYERLSLIHILCIFFCQIGNKFQMTFFYPVIHIRKDLFDHPIYLERLRMQDVYKRQYHNFLFTSTL